MMQVTQNHDELHPLVSIGMPVYNGEKTIRRALNSLLQQNYSNIEIVVCDNASTDHTTAIVNELILRNHQLLIKQFNSQVSIKQSYKRALDSRRGKYFMFAPADDYWAPDFIRLAVGFLERHLDYAGCCGHIEKLDENGQSLGLSLGTLPIESIQQRRLSDALLLTHDASRLYGLLRSDCLEDVIPETEPPGWDHYTIAKLAMRGKFGLIDAVAMYRAQTPRYKYAGLVASNYKGFLNRAFYRRDVLKLFDNDPEIPQQPWLIWKMARMHFVVKGAFSVGFQKDFYVVRLVFAATVKIIECLYRMISMRKIGR